MRTINEINEYCDENSIRRNRIVDREIKEILCEIDECDELICLSSIPAILNKIIINDDIFKSGGVVTIAITNKKIILSTIDWFGKVFSRAFEISKCTSHIYNSTFHRMKENITISIDNDKISIPVDDNFCGDYATISYILDKNSQQKCMDTIDRIYNLFNNGIITNREYMIFRNKILEQK